ncbi:hypothetical protein, partial [Burkholderia cepacia]|uniref:hypothetical protein n=1 Tax=Burkholderia cepacia TaxID=292 RepID=UPI001F0DEC5D
HIGARLLAPDILVNLVHFVLPVVLSGRSEFAPKNSGSCERNTIPRSPAGSSSWATFMPLHPAPSFAGPAAAENVAQCHVGIAPYEMPNADFIYCWQKI